MEFGNQNDSVPYTVFPYPIKRLYTASVYKRPYLYLHRFLALIPLCLGVSDFYGECFMLFLVGYIVELYYSN